jgi:hypothetical protein
MFGVALSKKRDDMAGTQTSPDCLGVVTAVAQYAVRTTPWAPPRARACCESLRLAPVS